MFVYELCRSGEYPSDTSLGLFASRDAIQRFAPEYTELVDSEEGFWLISTPEFAPLVRKARENMDSYWWYSLDYYGEKAPFYTVHQREVRE